MTTVNIKNNPIAPLVGSHDADAVVIESQQDTTSLVTYQIEKISTGDVITVDDSSTIGNGGNIISISRTTLKIILVSRTKYRVRTKTQWGSFGAWVNFTTRDKKYSSPHAITSLTDDSDSSAATQGSKLIGGSTYVAQGGSRVIVVTNNAKATERDNDARSKNERAPRKWGSVTVTNTDRVYNDGQLQSVRTTNSKSNTINVPVAFTSTGAKVINVPAGQNSRIRYTNRGATINTI